MQPWFTPLLPLIHAYNQDHPTAPWPATPDAFWDAIQAPDRFQAWVPTVDENDADPTRDVLGQRVLTLLLIRPLEHLDDEQAFSGGPGPNHEAGIALRQADLAQRRPLVELLTNAYRASLQTIGDQGTSRAYELLASSLNVGTFDTAFPCLAPLLAPTDQTPQRSLLATQIELAKRSNGPAKDIQTDLKVHTPSAVVGHLWFQALLQKDSITFHWLSPYAGWPVPVAAIHAALPTSPPLVNDKTPTAKFAWQGDLEDRLTVLIETPLVDRTLRAVLLQATKNLPNVAPITRQSQARDPHTGKAGWQVWLTQFTNYQALGEAPIHVQVALEQARQDPGALLQALDLCGKGPYTSTAARFIQGLIDGLAAPEMPSFNDHSRTNIDTFLDADRPWRHALLDEVLARVDLTQIPGSTHEALNWALGHAGKGTAAHLFPRLWAGVDVTVKNTWPQSLFPHLLSRSFPNQPIDLGEFDLAAHVNPQVVGFSLLQALALGKPLSSHFGDLDRWPLPVEAYIATESEQKREANNWGLDWIFKGLEKALDNPDYPMALRQRLYEACRAVRPFIAETRFIQEDRLADLKSRPGQTSPSRSRPRA